MKFKVAKRDQRKPIRQVSARDIRPEDIDDVEYPSNQARASAIARLAKQNIRKAAPGKAAALLAAELKLQEDYDEARALRLRLEGAYRAKVLAHRADKGNTRGDQHG